MQKDLAERSSIAAELTGIFLGEAAHQHQEIQRAVEQADAHQPAGPLISPTA
jgi:hypothetical protein